MCKTFLAGLLLGATTALASPGFAGPVPVSADLLRSRADHPFVRAQARETEDRLRQVIDQLQRGQPDYDQMEPVLRAAVRQQMDTISPMLRALGALQSVTYEGRQQNADVYDVHFANGEAVWLISLSPDGKIATLFVNRPVLGLSQSLEMAVKGPGRSRTARRKSSPKTTPTRPFLGRLTKFATGPFRTSRASSTGAMSAIQPSALNWTARSKRVRRRKSADGYRPPNATSWAFIEPWNARKGLTLICARSSCARLLLEAHTSCRLPLPKSDRQEDAYCLPTTSTCLGNPPDRVRRFSFRATQVVSRVDRHEEIPCRCGCFGSREQCRTSSIRGICAPLARRLGRWMAPRSLGWRCRLGSRRRSLGLWARPRGR